MITLNKDKLKVVIADTAEEMGRLAARDIADAMGVLLQKREEINMIFAAAPSQNTTLSALLEMDLPWERVRAFHMDEYIGLPADSTASFQTYLKEHLFNKAPFRSVEFIHASATDPKAECARYSALLEQYPVDIVVLGIGENGHIAFNDPPVADFNDPALVKPVELDQTCRQQQVHDGCFATIDDVPRFALTLTIPALTAAKQMFCVVPYATKAAAVRELLTTEHIDEHCPATALRLHGGATLYCDGDSAAEVTK